MKKEQVLRLAHAVKAISTPTDKVIEISTALLFEDPKLSLAIITEAYTIAEANSRLLDIVKEHSKEYLENYDDEKKVNILSGTK